MAETITPVVHGGRARWLGALMLHALGASLTAGLLGATLGWAGGLLGAPWGRAGLVALATVAAVYAIGELTDLRVPVPQLRRQVPDWWRTFFGRPATAALYGAGLGVGFLTYLAHGTLVVVAFAAIASGRPLIGAALMAPFGLVRGMSAAFSWGSDSPERSRALVDRLVSRPASRRRTMNGSVLLALTSLAAAASVGAPRGGWRLLASAVLATIWSWAACSKLFGWRRWRQTLDGHRLPPGIEAIAVWAVPAAEIAVAVLVIVRRPTMGAALALVMLFVFSAELLRARHVVGGPVPCGCFGGREVIEVRAALVRNAGVASIAALVLISGRDAPTTWPGVPVGANTFPFMLATVTLAGSVLTAWRVSVWLGRGRSV